MKRTLSAYIIFAFLLTTFPGCVKLAVNIGLNLPNNPNLSEVVNQLDNSSEIETKDLTEKESWNERSSEQSAQTPEPSNTSNKDSNQNNIILSPATSITSNISQPLNVCEWSSIYDYEMSDICTSLNIFQPSNNSSEIETKDLTEKESWNERSSEQSAQTPEPSNTSNKDSNQNNIILSPATSITSNISQPLNVCEWSSIYDYEMSDICTSLNIFQPSNNSSKIETKDLTEKENWNECVARRWEGISLSECI